MGYKINHGRLNPKKESTFGKVKKPFKSTQRNRKGNKVNTPRLRVDVSQRIVDKEYLSYLHTQNLKCFCCSGNDKIELHHIKESSSDAKNDRSVIPLCGDKCHRLGLELSAHGTPRKFKAAFPIEEQKLFALKLYLEYKSK